MAAPLTWLLLATGQASSSELIAGWVAAGRGWDTHDLIEPAAFLLVAGVLLGIVATLRISPVGPLVAGLLLISGYVATFIDPLAVRDVLPNDWVILDRPVPLHVPLNNGTLAVLGVLLLVAPFSIQRWRRWPVAAAAPAAEAPDTDETGDAAATSETFAGSGASEASSASDVSESDDVTQELRPVSPAGRPVDPAPAALPTHPGQAVSSAPPAPAAPTAPPVVAAPPKPAAPLTLASVSVPGPVVESPATKRAKGSATPPAPPQPTPQPVPQPQPGDPARRPAPGRPAPTAPEGPAPDDPQVPTARRPESPWSQPPSGPANRTRTPGLGGSSVS
ncbi:hypothetical protein JCM9534A_34520 [Catenuloplanes indicus JCM 9534]